MFKGEAISKIFALHQAYQKGVNKRSFSGMPEFVFILYNSIYSFVILNEVVDDFSFSNYGRFEKVLKIF